MGACRVFHESVTDFLFYGDTERSYAMRHELLKAAAELAQRCTCASGCPSCVGPAGIVGEQGKLGAIHLALGPDTATVAPPPR